MTVTHGPVRSLLVVNGEVVIPRDGGDPKPTHVTQYYSDNTRVSWDARNDGSKDKFHRTDQNKSKGSSGRHPR